MNADPFGEGSVSRLLTSVNCSGSESTLLDCGRTDFDGVTCPTAGIVCQGSLPCPLTELTVSEYFSMIRTVYTLCQLHHW